MEFRTYTEEIVVHHSASPVNTTVEEITRWHKERGFETIGYHKVQTWNALEGWHVEDGRDIRAVGAHCLSFNRTSIGYCFCGNWDRDKVPDDAFELLAAELAKLCYTFGICPSRIYFHRDTGANTLCPGINLCRRRRELIELVKMMIPSAEY